VKCACFHSIFLIDSLNYCKFYSLILNVDYANAHRKDKTFIIPQLCATHPFPFNSFIEYFVWCIFSICLYQC